MTETFVIYHGPHCQDGWAAAFSAWTVLGDAARYVPANYGDPPPEIPGGSTVYILDFSYPRDVLLGLHARCPDLLVLDHHKSAREALVGLDFARFDMEKSGAVLAWEHFRPGEPVPLLLQLVQDRDLWRWELPQSRQLNAGLSMIPRTFPEWGSWSRSLDGTDGLAARNRLYEWGHAILTVQARHVASLCDRATIRAIAGHSVPVVNSPLFQSEIGEELCRRHPEAPFAATFSVDGEGSAVYSLRSRNGSDVSEIAKSLGGGGHAAAAGFKSREIL